jgi:curved DNA-binding protein CbpA
MEKLEKYLKDLNNENLYKILHLEKTKDPEIIKRAYKKMIKKYHPDKNKEKNTVEIFEKIRKAYEILQNEEMKGLYDSYLDRKDEKAKRVKIYSETRKKFADDLKRREEESKVNNKAERENFSKNFSEKKFKHDDNDIDIDFDTFKSNNNTTQLTTTIPVKTFEDKLSTSGVKIKWSKESQLLFSKETIHSYFKDFGTIEEININEENCKAYILFTSNRAVINLMNGLNHNQNQNLSKLFRIKKCVKKAIPSDDPIKNLKTSFLDSNTINTLKNIKMMKNVEFMNKDKDMNEGAKSDKKKEGNSNVFSGDFILEDFEKAAFENLKMKFQKK